jgi:FKBP-type peptidyl-prolyl cis-trans isomerase
MKQKFVLTLIGLVFIGQALQAQTKKTATKAPAKTTAPQKKVAAKPATKPATKPAVKPAVKLVAKEGVTPAGIKYKLMTNNDLPKLGEYVKVHVKAYLSNNDSILLNTRDPRFGNKGEPTTLPIQESKDATDLMDIFPLIGIGGNGTVYVPVDTLFTKNPAQRPEYMKLGTNLVYVIDVLERVDQNQLMKQQLEAQKKMSEQEEGAIKQYIAKNHPNAIRTSTGLYVSITKPGTGDKPSTGQSVKVHYTGKLLNGKKFDSSVDRGQPFEFSIGKGQVIKGWDEGIAMLNRGAKGFLIIPSALGYGANGAGSDIPPYSPLEFEVEMIDFK